jgi:hypothetical protein
MRGFGWKRKGRESGAERVRPLAAGPAVERAASLYLDLLKRCLTRVLFPDESMQADLTTKKPFDSTLRDEGRDWPTLAETMIGMRRMDNLEASVREVLETGVPGDLVETGVWRGGAAILMRAVLEAYGVTDRKVWLADSFEGLPKPDVERYPLDAGDIFHSYNPFLGVSLDTVRENFRRYGLLDDQVRFLPGWFRDTLPGAPIDRIAVLRLDGDMYGSTMEALTGLYDRVSPGGHVIVDDYGEVPGCRAAVTDFRERRGIDAPLRIIDASGVFWRKTD